MTVSWTDAQALGVDAATGAGVPSAQALAFGAMLARHLADRGPEKGISAALDAPDTIVTLALRIERVVEAASMGIIPVNVTEKDVDQRAMLISWLRGLPCRTDLKLKGDSISVALNLSQPNQRLRPETVELSAALTRKMQVLAARAAEAAQHEGAGVGGGAGQMRLD